jgi:thiol-disulfide isomerase/thioredoxin
MVQRMRIPGRDGNIRSFLRARLWSWLGVGALVAGVSVAGLYGVTVDPSLLPESQRLMGQPSYGSEVDVRAAVEAGKARAAASGKMLMVTFGANWCPDCVTLHRNLYAPETRAYAEKHFEIVEIDVGDSKKSAAVQRDLGITVNTIPLAVFYSPTGEVVGDTFDGELKPSRHFSSRDIRDFLREVVDYHRIVSPYQRQ